METVSELIALRALNFPRALAVSDGERRLQYAELDERADAVAAVLAASGVGAGAVVGLRAPRSLAYLAGALGIMRAGAAYLPIDPSLPAERAEFQLTDASVSALVLATGVRETTSSRAPTIRLSDDGVVVGATSSPPSTNGARPPAGELAYVIYTSGSTGRPKGVEVTHAGLTNLTRWHREAFSVAPSDRASHIASVGFDAAVWEVWPYLAAGASVHIADDAVSRDPEALRDWLVDTRITIGFAATPLMERLMDLAWPPQTQLRTLLTGADTLRKYPPAALPFVVVNNYGPTEATVVATSGAVPAAAETPHPLPALPTIGKPIAGVRVYVLDEGRAAVQVGDEGEIWIAGAGVARGYVARPDLTRERFATDPLAGIPGERMYRTGDRGRVLPSGELAFAGRIDEQIKIRGFRIEAGEIEAALDLHPAIVQSAVVARLAAPGDERLVAYAVCAPGAAVPGIESIRGFLAARFPSYMLPSNVVWLAALPLTPNGKFDRAALRARDDADAPAGDAYVAPRTPVESALARIVAPLLKVEQVSVDDNFFTLGGHSLLGTQLIARIRDAFGVKIGLRYLFESPTIAALALEIERLTAARLETLGDELPPAAVLKRR